MNGSEQEQVEKPTCDNLSHQIVEEECEEGVQQIFGTYFYNLVSMLTTSNRETSGRVLYFVNSMPRKHGASFITHVLR